MSNHAEPSRFSWRRLMIVVAALGLMAVAVPVLARLLGWEAGPLAIAVSLMPWVTLACVVPLGLALGARAWWLAAASAAVLALCVGWAIPMYTSQKALGDPLFTVASVSLTFGRADADAVVALVEEGDVDLLAMQEVTPDSVEALRAAGLDDLMPFSEVLAEEGFTGTGLWSRTPLTNAVELEGFVSRAVQADVTVGGREVSVIAPHPAAPGPTSHAAWDADMSRLTEVLAAQEFTATLVIGDLNTTRDHQAFRDIQALGFHDAADQAGAGFMPTFPEGRRPFPLVAIDHALVGHVDLVATSVTTEAIPGADHLALLVAYSST